MLTVSIHDSLQPLTAAQWADLFSGHPDPPELIELVSNCGMEGFVFESMVIRKNETPVLLLPLFQTRYPVATSIDGSARERLIKLEKWVPDLVKPPVLGVGFVEGEYGQIGINRSFDVGTLDQAWNLAFQTLDLIARKRKLQAIFLWNFSADTIAQLPDSLTNRFCDVVSQPYCEFQVGFDNLDGYLQTLDKDMRRYLTRVRKNGGAITIERTRDIGAVEQQIFDMYKMLLGRVDMSFGAHVFEYFATITDSVPGAHYALYKLHGRLIGFELLIDRDDMLVSKYFAMDPNDGPQYKLYFLSWLANLEYCLERRIPTYYLGSAAEGLKVKLGARMIPGVVLFKHRNPLLNLIFRKCKHLLEYDVEDSFGRSDQSSSAKKKPVHSAI